MTPQEREELGNSFQYQNDNRSRFSNVRYGRVLILLISVLGVVFYVKALLYGNYSLEVLNELKKQKVWLNQEVQDLQAQNVKIQKMIFELKGLEPNVEEKK